MLVVTHICVLSYSNNILIHPSGKPDIPPDSNFSATGLTDDYVTPLIK